MPLSTDIRLPKSHAPVFPDRCVVCGVHAPGGTLRIGTNAIGWWTLALWSFGPRFSVEVPACERCRNRLWRGRVIRVTVITVLALAGAGVALYLLQGHQGPWKKWIAMGIALVCVAPAVVWQIFFPPPVDLTAYSKTVDYEFRDPQYALEFAVLNRSAIQDAADEK